MKRVMAVLMLALLMAEVSGIHDVSLASEQQTTTKEAKHRADIYKRASKIRISSMVKIERTDGTDLRGLLEAVTTDDVTVAVLTKGNTATETRTIALDGIKKIEKVSGVGVTVLKVAGYTVLVLVGIGALGCASLASSGTRDPGIVVIPPAMPEAASHTPEAVRPD